MNYREYFLKIKDVPASEKLEYDLAVFWLHPGHLPLKLVSLGGERSPVIKVPAEAVNRYGGHDSLVPVIGISGNAFSGNERVTDIILPQGIEKISAGAFAGCTNLRRITIPKKVRFIDEGTFDGCASLEDVYYEGTPDDWKNVVIVHCRHEIEFGKLISGTPVQKIVGERLVHVPGNDALLTANIHFRCGLENAAEPSEFTIKAAGKDLTAFFRTM